jgi:hypothetical protein
MIVQYRIPSSGMLRSVALVRTDVSEKSRFLKATRRHIPDILHSHRRENLKSYTALTGWTL